MTARLEELTKKTAVANNVGANGIILSEEAADNLYCYKGIPHQSLTIGEGVRSFSHVTEVRYILASDSIDAVVDTAENQSKLPQVG